MRRRYLNFARFLALILMPSCLGFSDQLTRNPKSTGPNVIPTFGEPWPKPQLLKYYYDGFLIIRPAIFRFEVINNTCDILDDALKRYYSIILQSNANLLSIAPGMRLFSFKELRNNKTWKAKKNFHGYLDALEINLLNPCETMPHDNMEESYKIKIDSPERYGKGILTSSSNWGILRGLETFVQLIAPTDDYSSLQVRSTFIMDYPRFKFRSILLDTSRHFLSKRVLFQNLDLMAMNKYNVFHWHIVDDQSFPYQSRNYPAISEKGSYHQYTHIYTQDDVAEIIEYARVRGIRVVPEFDTPGHTQSWGAGVPGLLTPCYGEDAELINNAYGPIDPTKSQTFTFLRDFFKEITNTFPDKYLHLGGDEVSHDCWKSNPQIRKFMKSHNFTDYSELEGYFMQNLIDIVKTFPTNNSYLVWQEVFDQGVKLNRDTIVHIWKRENIEEELTNVTLAGYRTIIYSCWYLNYISYGVDWHKYYSCDPHNFNGTDKQKQLVFGGGAAMWGEYVDSTNLIPRLWPRAAVPAERLWSNRNVNDTTEAERRLEEHRCRLLKRGFSVEPANGFGYCLISWD